MKTLIASVIALSVAASLAGQADAAVNKKKKRLHAGHHSRAYAYRDNDDSLAGYYEHRLDAVRFGSQRWWKIYDEQHGGGHRR